MLKIYSSDPPTSDEAVGFDPTQEASASTPVTHGDPTVPQPVQKALVTAASDGALTIGRPLHRCLVIPDDGSEDDDDSAEQVRDGAIPQPLRQLPAPPVFDPSSHRLNMHDAEASYEDKEWEVVMLIDRYGQPPDVAYLVHWADHEGMCHFVATWEWADNLHGLQRNMTAVDKWKNDARHHSLSFTECARFHGLEFGVSSTGLCFFEAVRLGCQVIGDPDLVSKRHVEGFRAYYENLHQQKLSDGIRRKGIESFIYYLRQEGSALALNVFSCNILKTCTRAASQLEIFMLLPGLYVVGAQDINKVSHCFALQGFHDSSPRKIYDDFDADHELEAFSAKLLSTQKWIDKVRFIRAIQRVGKIVRKKRKTRKTKIQERKRIEVSESWMHIAYEQETKTTKC